ncbi:MAG: VCBS repeat-containing protein [Acidobacteria bacterium]|nr:MAG: VCBS repeat-containing protein [Acidobacteriota bacterium]REK01377.1 MAG: VCBS repeat-containing protein [Acidobacteriota bacterium]REK14333.1 MAG: VCBS repeat-containing protein [Acidobacteriota bacterium]REK45048.1 MAG: VCBS repeat-containing protein [Acidobacteriota bacterium]
MKYRSLSILVKKELINTLLSRLATAGLFIALSLIATNVIAARSDGQLAVNVNPVPGTNLGDIPDAISGCGNPAPTSRDVMFDVSGMLGSVTSVEIQVTIDHNWVGDISATLIAPDATEHLLFGRTGATAAFPCGDGSALSGVYTFRDSAAGTNWWTAAADNVNSVPPGAYRTTETGPLAATTNAPLTELSISFPPTMDPNGVWILRLNDVNFEDVGSVTAATLTITTATNPGAAYLDFDGDGATDVSVWRPSPEPPGSDSQWWFLFSGNDGTRGLNFGTSTDIPVPADFTGDGKTDIAFFRPSTAEWFVLRSDDDSFFAFPFGATGDVPAPGDFDGDGIDDPAVFRPSSATWFIYQSSNGAVSAVGFGIAEDLPTIADFDGDDIDDIAVFRPSVQQWWQLRSSDGPIGYSFGSPGDLTTVGDYTGDGKADLAFFRPSLSTWYVVRSENPSFFAFPWGSPGDTPAPGDYDGDGITDAAVYRNSDRTWYILGSTSGFFARQFGVDGDVPLPTLPVHP